MTINMTGQVFIPCGRCKARVDMVVAKRKAEQRRQREIVCPRCG